MNKMPDIGQLYEQKYLASTPLQNTSYLNRYNSSSLQGCRTLSQYTSRPQSRSNIKCIIIVTASDKFTPKQLLKETKCPKKQRRGDSFSSQKRSDLGSTQSMHLPNRSSELLRQLMRVSHQQMGELEQSTGGQKRLKTLFQQFFIKRNKSKQQKQYRCLNNEFMPMHSTTERVRRPSLRQALGRKKESQREMQSVFCHQEKQIAPWNIHLEGDFS